MAYNKSKMFTNQGFPSPLAPDEEKATYEYGLQIAKQIQFDWFYKSSGQGTSRYYNRRDKFHNLRLYARGENDTKGYKNLLLNGDDSDYVNLDWRNIGILPKMVKLIVGQIGERLFEIKVNATDNYSTDLKNNHKKYLEDLMYAQPAMAEAKAQMGVDLYPPNYEDMPQTQEEINTYMSLSYKSNIEIAAEECLKHTLSLNTYEETQRKVIEDLVVLGIGGVKHETDNTKGIVVRYVDPADTVSSFSKHSDFSEATYYGEVRRLTIGEVKRLSNKEFTDEELENIYQGATEFLRYNSQYVNEEQFNDSAFNTRLIDVLFFNYKTTNTLSYKKKYNKNNGFKMTRKESTFTKGNKDYDGFDVSAKTIDVWYEGCLVLGTNHLFNYKKCENMIREEGLLNLTYPNYVFYATDIYQNRTKSLVEIMSPFADQAQMIHLKLQQLIAKARSNGIYIDVAGLSDINMGDGNVLTPLEVINIYNATGNVIGTSVDAEGSYNYGRQPVTELKNGVIDGLDRLINAYNHYVNLMRDSVGLPQGTDASTVNPEMAASLQQQLASSSNIATRHILDASLSITKRLGKSLALRLKDIFLYSNLKEVYINAIGKINVETLEALKNFSLYDLGLIVELKPDIEDRQRLEQSLQIALQSDQITIDDIIDVRKISNTKLANEVLKSRRSRREKMKQQQAQQLQQQQAEGQAMVAERASQARMQEYQVKMQTEQAIVAAKSQAKLQELDKEAQVKSKLMEQEFQYNMQLQGMTVNKEMGKAKYLEDRKDARQDRGNTQDSEKIQQKQFNLPAKNFESTEDNLSGSVDMGEIGPH